MRLFKLLLAAAVAVFANARQSNQDTTNAAYYSTVTQSSGENIVLVDTILFVTATVTGNTDVTATKKLSSTTHVTSTYYVLPTTVTTSLNVTKTVTASQSTSTVPTASKPPSSPSVHTAYCLDADDNTKVPCSTTTSTGENPSSSAESSQPVDLSDASHTASTARRWSVVAAVAMLFCAGRLGPISTAFLAADVITQRGMGSLVFVAVSLLLMLMCDVGESL